MIAENGVTEKKKAPQGISMKNFFNGVKDIDENDIRNALRHSRFFTAFGGNKTFD